MKTIRRRVQLVIKDRAVSVDIAVSANDLMPDEITKLADYITSQNVNVVANAPHMGGGTALWKVKSKATR
jgi:hypothetical protein